MAKDGDQETIMRILQKCRLKSDFSRITDMKKCIAAVVNNVLNLNCWGPIGSTAFYVGCGTNLKWIWKIRYVHTVNVLLFVLLVQLKWIIPETYP
jgi:hypothetical protein